MIFTRPRASALFATQLHLGSIYKFSPATGSWPWRRQLATARRGAELDEVEVDTARKWLTQFSSETIPRDICEVSFSRSSGPGGQNVNKISSKATLRVPISSLLLHVPSLLHPAIRSSRYCATKSSELVIQADEARKQNDNIDACYRKLQALIVQAGKDVIPGETSIEQSRRVAKLQQAEVASRRRAKESQSKKKSARRGNRGDD